MRHRKRLGLVALLVVLAGTLAWLAATTAGLRFIVARALPLLPLELEIGAIEGRLAGPLVLAGVEFEAPGVAGTIERLELDWRPRALLARTVHLVHLEIDSPRLWLRPGPDDEVPATEEPASDWQLYSVPLRVVVERFRLDGGSVHGDSGPLLEALTLEFAGELSGQGLALDRLSLAADGVELAGRARASLDPSAPWDVDLRWRVPWQDAALAGRGAVRGTLPELALQLALSAPAAARIEGTVRDLVGTPAWDLAIELEALPAASGPWPPAADGLAASLRSVGMLEQATLEGRVTWPAGWPGNAAVEALGGWRDETLALDRVALALPGEARLELGGWLRPAPEVAAELVLDGRALRWPLDGEAVVVELPRLNLAARGQGTNWHLEARAAARHEGLPEAEIDATALWAGTTLVVERLGMRSTDDTLRATARGRLETADPTLPWQASAEAEFSLPDWPAGSARLEANGDQAGAHIDTLAANLLGGTLEGQGRIAWSGDEAADFALRFSGIDPGSLAPDWHGRLAGEVTVRGLPQRAGGLEVAATALSGELRGLPVEGEAALNIEGEAIRLRRARLEVGRATAVATGRLDGTSVALDLEMQAPDLGALLPGARGELVASARVDGPRAGPRLELQASGNRLRWRENRARSLQVDALIDPAGTEASRLLAQVEGLATAPGPGATLRLEGAGLPTRHEVRLEYLQRQPERRLALALAGGLDEDRWQGEVSAIELDEASEPVWRLRAPAALAASGERVVVDEACMDGTLGLLCLGGEWLRGGPWRGRATLAQLDLGPLSEWLGSGLLARGVVTGLVAVAADDDGFQALSGGLALTAGDIRIAEEDSEPLIAWDGGVLEFTGDETEARARLELALSGVDHLEGRLAIGWNAADPPLAGRLEAELGQLQLISELLPELAELDGRASAQAELAGTLAAPRLTGRFEWREGTAYVPLLGIRPRDIDVQARLEGGNLSFTATGQSGEGRFTAGGEFDLGAAGVQGRATLQGDALLLADLPEARVAASPDLRLAYAGNELTLGGEVAIPFARITGLAGPTAVTTSTDEVIVGPRAAADEQELAVSSRIRIRVGPDVQVQAAGLRGRVEGSLLTVLQPQSLPWGRGELRVVDGTFGVFGQRLDIETGRLIYTGGPLENPGLEIRAVRRVDSVTAGALVRGTLQDPEISVYSDPPMPRAEALSYLTLGKSLDELQSGEQRTVNQAANSLALSGGGLIAQDLGRRLGFDDVAVTADDASGGAALVVSKYLGAGLYVSYGLGLFDTVNTLRLRYQINQRLSVEATSGAEAAADLFYTFERD